MKISNGKIEVRETSGMGRGVFAISSIKKGEVIEVAPVLVLSFEDLVETRWNILFDYYFWMDDFIVLALGFGSIYNHSDENNAEYEINSEEKIITFRAIKDIENGEEIYFNYRGNSSSKDDRGKDRSKTPLWFERN